MIALECCTTVVLSERDSSATKNIFSFQSVFWVGFESCAIFHFEVEESQCGCSKNCSGI